jgi:hypothetical protein
MKNTNNRGETKKKARQPETRIFPWNVDWAAFLDKIVLSIDGQLKQDFAQHLLDVKSTGIFHPGTIYSRRVSGIFSLTGNPGILRYGKAKKFQNVPDVQLIIQSQSMPVTAAQSTFLVKQLTQNLAQITVSSLEMTFDVRGTTVGYLRRHLIHRAKSPVRSLGKGKRKTLYVGSVRSAWQARIYQKRREVVRLEFILRRAFLSKNGINQLEDVLLLRKLKIWDLLSIRRFSASSAARVTRTWKKNPWGKQIVRTWGPYGRALGALPPILRNNGVHPNRVLRRTRLQRRLAAMQRRFVW